MTEENIKECSCSSFERRTKPSDSIFEYFKIIATTKENNKESTTVLQCPRCSSYYLLQIYNPVKYDNKPLSISKYNPKTDDSGLVKILSGFSGIIIDKDIDTYSEVYTITKQSLKRINPKRWMKNASQN
jgi:hypothetical protein